jgi:hypothetical protein
LFAAVLMAAPGLLAAQGARFRPAPNFVAGGKADQEEGRRLLGEFRRAGLTGTYWLSFELRVMPRRGDERVVEGELFGAQGRDGSLTRVGIGEARWLIQSGPAPAAWTAPTGAAVRAATMAETLQPVAGTDFTLFDLQMPFLYWSDFVYEGLAKVRGRPAHQFVLYPPTDFTPPSGELTGVRVYLDTQFNALVQAEQLDAKGKPAKTVTLIDLKKVGERWLVKTVDLRNHVTRDKTRLTFKAAALDLVLPAAVFEPAGLTEPAPPVPREKLQAL